MLCALLLAIPTPIPALMQADDRAAAFAEALDGVHAQMERRRWGKAKQELDDLLLAHRGADYALAQELQIREDMRRIAFQISATTPDPADLVSGELNKYSDKGDIDITISGPSLNVELSDERDGYLSWPAAFAGNYEVTLSGDSYPKDEAFQIILDQGDDYYYICVFGEAPAPGQTSYIPTTLSQYGKGKIVELDRSKRPNLEAGEPYEVNIKVTSSKISVKTQGKAMVSAKRVKEDHGWFSIAPISHELGDSLSVHIKGKLEPSWMQNKIDAALEGQRDAFEASYDESDYLPSWFLKGEITEEMVAEPEPTGSLRDRASGKNRNRPQPKMARKANHNFLPGPAPGGSEEDAFDRALEELADLIAGPLQPQLEFVAEVELDGQVSPLLSNYLSLLVKFRGGLFEDALPHAEAIVREAPAHFSSRVMLGEILDALKLYERADGVWAAFASDFQGDQEVLLKVAFRFLLEGRSELGKSWMLELAKDEDMRELLRPAQELYVMAESGPDWGRRYEDDSRYYIVQSDLSEDICEQATRLLERAYTSYSLHLKKVDGLEKSKFRVFLFSGEEGYKRYASNAFGGGEPESTAGVYSPLVKQLLIWNLPDRDDMFKTVLHEGFHQYLDQVMPDPPVWLNEGMAEYFELQETVGGKWTEGQIHDRDLRVLVDQGLAPMAKFIRLNHETFREPATTLRNYAQGWLYVHYLRNTTRENKQFFEDMFETLCERGGGQAVVEEVFADVDLGALDSALKAHLESLRRG